jgi:hypothetical protein
MTLANPCQNRSAVRHVDADTVDVLVALNERVAGPLTTSDDVPVPAMHLRASGPAFFRHELSRLQRAQPPNHSPIREAGATEPYEMTGVDLIHNDFRPENILCDERGRITGVVDWQVLRGDWHFALVGMVSHTSPV